LQGALFAWPPPRSGGPAATEQGLRLAGALGYWYWHGRGRRLEGLEWLNRLLSLPAAPVDSAGRGAALLAHTFLASVRPDGVPLRADAADAPALCLAADRPRAAGVAEVVLGQASPDLRQRQRRFRVALGLFRRAGDRWGIGLALRFLAADARATGRALWARVLDLHALAAFRLVGDRWFGGATLRDLGRDAAVRGDAAEARVSFAEALALHRELRHRHGEATTLCYLAAAMARQWDDPEGALRHCAAAAAIYAEAGSRSDLAQALVTIGELLLTLGKAEQALIVAGAVAAFETTGAAPGTWSSSVGARLEHLRRGASGRVGPSEAAAAYLTGRAMPPECTIASVVPRSSQIEG
jgi:tetratricopeptide (TPR) repeat protein